MTHWIPPVPDPPGESPDQWAKRVLAEHGPPPKTLRDLLAQLRSQVATRKARDTA